MTELRLYVLAVAAMAACIALLPSRAHAQWWRVGPKDFEECADIAEKAKSKQEKTSSLAECNAKFAGRRKPAGGYTYYDFMQDRSFDIAGPNPTPEEQKKIDEQYTRYLEKQRRETIATAMAAKQQQQHQQEQLQRQQEQPQPQLVSLRTGGEKIPLPVAKPQKSQAPAGDMRHGLRTAACTKGSFSCEWPRLSHGLDGLKKLFNPPPAKPKRS